MNTERSLPLEGKLLSQTINLSKVYQFTYGIQFYHQSHSGRTAVNNDDHHSEKPQLQLRAGGCRDANLEELQVRQQTRKLRPRVRQVVRSSIC